MIDNGEYNIRPDVDYKSLQNDAENKLLDNVCKEAKRFRDYLILCALSLLMILTCLLVDKHRFENSIVNHDITAYLGGIGATLLAVIGLFIFIIAVIGLFKCLKRIKVLISVYKVDLKKAKETLENYNIFMDIPTEDINKYNNVFRLTANSLKNRKKTLENQKK